MKRIPFTKEGYEAVKKEYEQLLKERPSAVLDLKKAREMGDLSENGYYKSARFKLSGMDHRLRELRNQVNYGYVHEKSKSDTITIGSTVTLLTGETELVYSIVGDFEANPKMGKISTKSPLGTQLVGRKQNEHVEIITPSGTKSYSIKKIQ